MNSSVEIAVFGGGCFWCTEALFRELKGVVSVASGYAGGAMEKPSYEAVSTGRTGHAEVIQVQYEPGAISYEKLLEVFFSTHDPTTLNQQGNDVGEQYRSVIFYTTDKQRKEAEDYIQKLRDERAFQRSIVTEVKSFEAFYPAEDYHQRFYERNPEHGYCKIVIAPKLKKLQEKHSELLAKNEHE